MKTIIDTKEKAIDAAAAYLERAGYTDIERTDSDYPLFAYDGDIPVMVAVVVKEKDFKDIVLNANQLPLYRIDLITLNILGSDRVLLRHHRDYLNTEI